MNRRFAYLLLLLSGLGVALIVGRYLYTGTVAFAYLIWNALLAWIPLLVAWFLSKRWKHIFPSIRYATVLVWLLFFPNAPYLMTDLIHLRDYVDAPVWYDAVILMVFAWLGLIVGFASLYLVHRVLQARFGLTKARVFVYVSLLLSSFGIYIGRFLRWNSWDIVSHPIALLWESAIRITEPTTLAVILVFTGFLTLAYATVTHFPGNTHSHD